MTQQLDIIKAPQSVQVRRVLETDTAEDVAVKVALMEAMKEWVKQASEDFEQSLKDYIEANGPIIVGELRYFVGAVRKPPKCVNVPGAVQALLEAVAGDFDRFCEHLTANPIKYGAASQTLPAALYGRLFRAEEVEQLQSEEAAKAQKKLQKADPKYMRSKVAC